MQQNSYDLAALLDQAYAEASLDLAIDYSAEPIPALNSSDAAWLASLESK